VVLLIAGFLSDVFLPPFEERESDVIFCGSYTVGFTLANVSLLFLAILLFIVLVSVSQSHIGPLNTDLLIRRLLVGLVLMLLLAGSTFGSIYVLTKKIIVSDEKFQYFSLVERKEVPWSDIKSIDGNFVGNRLGFGKQDYAWVDFTLKNGEIVHLSLRFVRGLSYLEQVIQKKLAAFSWVDL
jgi:hypothetical protein